jgi:hypothetical protein
VTRTPDADRIKNRYFFGRTIAKRIDMFAFPRTGSHFFRYCTQGLFDLVAIPGAAADRAEAIERQRELNPDILYALDLREDGVPFQPVWFNTTAAGQHGLPLAGGAPTVILTREPIATIYSYLRVNRDRPGFGGAPSDVRPWIGETLRAYHAFLSSAQALLSTHPNATLVVRYEELRVSPEPLRRLVALVGVRPKLAPEFVHHLTRFETIAVPGDRTFYRAGDNDAWRKDAGFVSALEGVDIPDFSRFDFVERAAR